MMATTAVQVYANIHSYVDHVVSCVIVAREFSEEMGQVVRNDNILDALQT